MKPPLTDEAARRLLQRILAGDRDAYAEIVSGYQDAVRAVLGTYGRSAEEVEDFCHTAFVEAYFRLPDYRPERGPFLPWILALARNCVLEEFRRRKSEGRRLHRYVERAATLAPRYDDVARANQALERCLSEVDAEESLVIKARYREGRSCDEIAVELGKTGTAVRKLLQRLRERLRACVERRLVGAEGAGS